MKRRNFIQAAALTAVAIPETTELFQDKKNNFFVHHVFFYLKDNNAANRAKLVEGLRKLTKIKHVKAYNIGIPAKTNRDVVVKDYSISWLTYFKDAAGEQKYQDDPIHTKFVEEHKYLWMDVKVYDSEAVIF